MLRLAQKAIGLQRLGSQCRCRRAFNTTPEISRSLAEENKDIASMDKLLRIVSASENDFRMELRLHHP